MSDRTKRLRAIKANKPKPVRRPPDMMIRQIMRQVFSNNDQDICGYQDVGHPIVGIAGKAAKQMMVTQQYIKGAWHDIPILVPATKPTIAVPAGADLGTKNEGVKPKIIVPIGANKEKGE